MLPQFLLRLIGAERKLPIPPHLAVRRPYDYQKEIDAEPIALVRDGAAADSWGETAGGRLEPPIIAAPRASSPTGHSAVPAPIESRGDKPKPAPLRQWTDWIEGFRVSPLPADGSHAYPVYTLPAVSADDLGKERSRAGMGLAIDLASDPLYQVEADLYSYGQYSYGLYSYGLCMRPIRCTRASAWARRISTPRTSTSARSSPGSTAGS